MPTKWDEEFMTSWIYLARHGETSLNAAGLLRGRLDPPLTARGREQASALAGALGNVNIHVIVTGPLRRAVETASAVADRLGLSVIVDDRFNDRDYGEWAGTSLEDVEAQWGSVDDAPGVEPLSSVAERAMSGFRDIGEMVDGGAGLIVSHDAVNRPLLIALDPSLQGPPIAQQTGCYNILRTGDDGWRVVSVNNVPAQHP
jgi:probable phosphoglycerate mutase